MKETTIIPGTNGTSSEDDGIDRRGFLDCMRWAGAGLIWTLQGGIPTSRLLGAPTPRNAAGGGFWFKVARALPTRRPGTCSTHKREP